MGGGGGGGGGLTTCCRCKKKSIKYRVKVINPKESITIDWHGVSEKFSTVAGLKTKLSEPLSAHVPQTNTKNFSITYYHGWPQVKSWIVSEQDLQFMYNASANREILLWCDGKGDEQEGTGRKHRRSKRDMLRTETQPESEGSLLVAQNLHLLHKLRKRCWKNTLRSCIEFMRMSMIMVSTECGHGQDYNAVERL